MPNFNTKEELLLAAKKAKIHEAIYEWMEQRTLSEIFKEISLRNRLWCLRRGWEQFAVNCNWNSISESEQSFFTHCLPNMKKLIQND
jgi:ornithine carbamoyltransferase